MSKHLWTSVDFCPSFDKKKKININTCLMLWPELKYLFLCPAGLPKIRPQTDVARGDQVPPQEVEVLQIDGGVCASRAAQGQAVWISWQPLVTLPSDHLGPFLCLIYTHTHIYAQCTNGSWWWQWRWRGLGGQQMPVSPCLFPSVFFTFPPLSIHHFLLLSSLRPLLQFLPTSLTSSPLFPSVFHPSYFTFTFRTSLVSPSFVPSCLGQLAAHTPHRTLTLARPLWAIC